MSSIKETIRQEIEFLKELNEGLYTEGDNSYYEGQDNACNHILAFIDSLPEDDLPKTKGWVARNKDESLVFCYHKPHRENSITQEWWGSCDADFRIYDDAIDEQFKDLSWEDEPREVELFIKPIDEPKEMSVDEAMAYLEEKIAKASKSWEGVDVDKFMDEIRGREDRNDDNLPRYYGD